MLVHLFRGLCKFVNRQNRDSTKSSPRRARLDQQIIQHKFIARPLSPRAGYVQPTAYPLEPQLVKYGSGRFARDTPDLLKSTPSDCDGDLDDEEEDDDELLYLTRPKVIEM